MARELRQSTSVDVPIGPFVDATDGVTPETALTITQPDVRLKKNGAAWAQKAAAQTLSHEENGFYEVTLDATDTNTLGLMRLAVFESGAAPMWEDFLVITQGEWDAKYLTAVRPTAAQIAAAIWDLDATAHQTQGTFGQVIGDSGLGGSSIYSILGTPGGTIASDINDLTALVGAVPTAAENATELLDQAAGIETNRTLRQTLRLMLAALAGKASGMATTTATFRDTNDTTDRIVATVTADGDRTAVTLDAS